MSMEQQIRNEQFKRATGSAPNFRAIDGVGAKTAEKVKDVFGIDAPSDAADKTADELASEAGISKNRARKVIRGGGGNPDIDESAQTGSVSAGNIADAMDSRTREAGAVVDQRRDLFENVVQVGDKVPDRRERRRGNFGPLEGRDPEEVREIGRAAETFRRATNDPIDPTESRQTFGFDPDRDRERAGQVAVAAQEYLEREQGLDFDEAGQQINTGNPDLGTVEQATSGLLGPRRSPDSGLDLFAPRPTQPTDIGREADGEFARPESDPDIRPAPIDRSRKTGRFGTDPFDLGSGLLDDQGGADDITFGENVESREIEFGGATMDLTQQDTDELEQMNDFLSRNADAEVSAERARGGFGTSDMAQDFSARQVQVQSELDRRR